MEARTIGEMHDDTLKIQAYLLEQANGTVLSYEQLYSATGVRMDNIGKARLKSALRSIKRESSTVRGKGIRLADAHSAISIISTRFQRIDGAVRRADKSQRILQAQFLAEMNDEDKRKILFAGAVFGAIRLAAEQGRSMHKQLIEPTVRIALPDL
jgi:hypothetical protein